ncbi:MAG: hypothetical protein A2287_04685 [Candidatus Melainabacteria bacterium RIFOXYA12_FULL_32_12]|nr:MAG: hypothetical protein A2287_04685 [Candidatus Melainabacteria bacterium RIFOXYA12_FULL_32_12]
MRNKKILLTVIISLLIVIGAIFIDNKGKQKAYKNAVILMSNNDWDLALVTFEKLGNYKDAKSQAETARYKTFITLADKSMLNKNYSEALKYYSKAKSINIKGNESILGIEKAQKLYNIKLKLEAKKHLDNANIHLNLKKYELAIIEYNKALKLDKSLNKIAASKLKQAEKLLQIKKKNYELVLEKQRKYEERKRIADNMNYFEGNNIQIAVHKVKSTKETEDRYMTGNGRFIWVGITTKNNTSGTVHVNPNYFTLSTSDGYTVSHSSESYSLSNYFDAVNLPPNGETSGWLIFPLSKDSKYILHFNSFNDSVDKQIVVN